MVMVKASIAAPDGVLRPGFRAVVAQKGTRAGQIIGYQRIKEQAVRRQKEPIAALAVQMREPAAVRTVTAGTTRVTRARVARARKPAKLKKCVLPKKRIGRTLKSGKLACVLTAEAKKKRRAKAVKKYKARKKAGLVVPRIPRRADV